MRIKIEKILREKKNLFFFLYKAFDIDFERLVKLSSFHLRAKFMFKINFSFRKFKFECVFQFLFIMSRGNNFFYISTNNETNKIHCWFTSHYVNWFQSQRKKCDIIHFKSTLITEKSIGVICCAMEWMKSITNSFLLL